MSKPNLKKLVRRIVATVEVPESMRESDCQLGGRDGLSPEQAIKIGEKFRAHAIRVSADVEVFNIKLQAAIEVAQDEGAQHIEVCSEGYWNPSEVKVVGWFQPTEKELRRMNGTAKSLLTRKVQQLPKYQIGTWAREIQSEITSAFENASLEVAGLKKEEEFDRLIEVFRTKCNALIDEAKARGMKG